MQNPPKLTTFTLPAIIDISNGPVTAAFSAEAVDDPSGDPPVDLVLMFKEMPYMHLLRGYAETPDRFGDATPMTWSSQVPFDGSVAAGVYHVEAMGVVGAAGTTWYDPAQMAAMGWATTMTVVNRNAPAAPTMTLADAVGGVLGAGAATLAGKAAPGSEVTVWTQKVRHEGYTQYVEHVALGVAQADAGGHWTLTAALADGEYALVRATASSAGNTSPYSDALAFRVAAQAPAAPRLDTHVDGAGHAHGQTPFITGVAAEGSTVRIYDGNNLVATTTADTEGWFGVRTAPLAAGTHALTAVASYRDDIASSSSAPLAVAIDNDAPAGIRFDVADVTSLSSTTVDQAALQARLDDVGVMLSSLIDGAERVAVHVHVGKPEGHLVNATAAAGADVPKIDPHTGMPTISDVYLWLSDGFANDITNQPYATGSTFVVMTHEMLHGLGFNSLIDMEPRRPEVDTPFGRKVEFIGGKPYFNGFYARAAHGGPVELANSAHLALEDDVMFVSAYGGAGGPVYLREDNPTAPLTAVDLAILKDLGYTIRDAFVSRDGHTFIAGSGKPGHDRVTGTAGRDTLAVDGKAADHVLDRTAAGFSLKDGAHGVTFQLDDIERVRFADGVAALDVGAGEAGGLAYRLYQAAFGRTPDAAGLGYWIDRIDGGAGAHDVAAAFVGSAEFAALYGATPTDRQFVDALYANVLHRAPDAGGVAYWMDALHDGEGRAAVLAAFSESGENVTAVGTAIADGFLFAPYAA